MKAETESSFARSEQIPVLAPGASQPGLTTNLLNTPYFGRTEVLGLEQYFRKVKKLGSYSIIELSLQSRKPVRIVVDQNRLWLQSALEDFFQAKVETLTLAQIEEFLDHLRGNGPRSYDLVAKLGLAPQKDMSRSSFLRVFYLEDIRGDRGQKPLVLALIAQILIEKYTKHDSRVAVLEEVFEGATRRGFVVLIKRGRDFEVLDPMRALACSNGRPIRAVAETVPVGIGGSASIEILHNDFSVSHPNFAWSEKNKSLSIISSSGGELLFSVAGRTPTERRFKQEEDRIRQAGDDELVPVEIGFHPFYRPLGHTSIRIGETLYELTAKGWKCHGDGTDSPRAFLYNNPFFKKQYALFAKQGMPPISISASILLPKKQVAQVSSELRRLTNARGWQKERFWLLFNNCNQGIMRVLKNCNVPGFTDKGYLGFSSILSFRRLLVEPSVKVDKLYIYPLPGTEVNETSLRRWIPRLIYRHNTPVQEVIRVIPGFIVVYGVIISSKIAEGAKLIAGLIRSKPKGELPLPNPVDGG